MDVNPWLITNNGIGTDGLTLLGMNLIQDLDGKYPKGERPMPSLMVPRAASPEVRADLAVAMSMVAQLLMSERNGKIPVAANSFDQFHVRQVG